MQVLSLNIHHGAGNGKCKISEARVVLLSLKNKVSAWGGRAEEDKPER